MRISGPLGRLVLYAVCGGGTLGVLGPTAAAAQQRSAAIRVHATVRGVADTDVLGAQAVRTAPTGAGAESGAWRILSGRRSSVGIQVDGAEGVTLCERSAERAETCQPYRAPRLATSADRPLSELVLRVNREALRGQDSVRVTVAFIAF